MANGYIDIPAFGSASWKAAVANSAALPLVGNGNGDARVTLDTDSIYIWSTSDNMWHQVSSGGGTGTVSTVSVVTANGFAGTVLNPTTTPAITLTTTVTGLLKGNGTVVSAATPGTDYQAAGNYITALTGDATASGPGSAALTLATVNSSIGTFNTVTVNAKGLVTSASNTSYEAPLTFSTGLTRVSNTITSNLSTGSAGGQTAIGGTAAGESLAFTSTLNASKGSIFFGATATYNEATDTWGFGIAPSTVNKTTFADTVLAGSGSLAGSLLNMTQTWNTTGSPTSIKLNVTNTASGAAALLMDLQVAGASQFSVSKTGQVVSLGNYSGNSGLFATSVRVGAGGQFFWQTRSQIFSPADGTIRLTDSTNALFNLLQFGGTTSSFPALKRSTTSLGVRLADDSADANITAAQATLSNIPSLGTTATNLLTSNAGVVSQRTIAQVVSDLAMIDVQVFTSSGTWTKPANTRSTSVTNVFVVAGGGGGGSGAKQVAAAACSGGAGGSTAGSSFRIFNTASLSATETVTVAAPSAGGAAQTTNTTAGNIGTAGNDSTFGPYIKASGGGGGQGGQLAANSSGGVAGIGMFAGFVGGNGANGAVGSSVGTGGTAGGGVSAAVAAFAGGAWTNGLSSNVVFNWSTLAGGTINNNGNNGAQGANAQGQPGTGGGSSVTVATNGGIGGTGGYGAGGGGGGSAANTAGNSGAGGIGGGGIIVAITNI